MRIEVTQHSEYTNRFEITLIDTPKGVKCLIIDWEKLDVRVVDF